MTRPITLKPFNVVSQTREAAFLNQLEQKTAKPVDVVVREAPAAPRFRDEVGGGPWFSYREDGRAGAEVVVELRRHDSHENVKLQVAIGARQEAYAWMICSELR